MNYWKIGSRWSKVGDKGKTLVEVFVRNKVVFCGADVATKNEIADGDLVAIADGHKIIAICKAVSNQDSISKDIEFTSKEIAKLGTSVFEIVNNAVGVKVDDIIRLQEPIIYNFRGAMAQIKDEELKQKLEIAYKSCSWNEYVVED